MAKLVRPVFYKWQQNFHELSVGPVLRHIDKLTVSYYPFSPRINAITHFTNIIHSAKQPREKKFEFKHVNLPHGGHATIDIEYRNGDKLSIDAEKYNAQEILEIMKLKRLDMEKLMEWAEINVHLTLEEEAIAGGDADKKKDDKKKGGKGGKAPAKGKK